MTKGKNVEDDGEPILLGSHWGAIKFDGLQVGKVIASANRIK